MSETMKVYEPDTANNESDLVRLENEKNNLLSMADSFLVNDRESFNLASEFITGVINPFIDQVKETFSPIVKAAHNTWKKAKEQQSKYEDPATEAKAILNRKKGNWELAEMKRIEEENRRKLAEERRIEQERLKAEAEAQAIAQKAIAEAQLARAVELEQSGQKEQSDKVLSAQMPTPVVSIPAVSAPIDLQPTVEKTEGEKKIVEWVWHLKSEENFESMSKSFLTPDKVKINRAVSAHGKDAEKLVGNIVVEERIRYAYDRKK